MDRKKIKKKHGFSLVEMSIVMTIAATVAVGYMTWIASTASTEGEYLLKDQQKLNTIDKAIKRFRIARGRLPCPAKSEIPATESSTGITNSETYFGNVILFDDEYMQIDSSGSACNFHVGAVPTRALGLPTDYMFDSWGRKFTYHVAPSLCAGSPSTCTADVYDTNDGNIIITTTTAEGASNITLNAAYVLQAHGLPGNYAYLRSGNFRSVTGFADETTNGQYVTSTAFPEISPVTYRAGPRNELFRFITIFKTKNQLESEIVAPTGKAIPRQFCDDNRTRLAALNQTAFNDAFTNITSTRIDIGGSQFYNEGDQAMLDLLWIVQELCFAYYENAATAYTKVCPAGATYETFNNTCNCANGGWNGSC